MIIYKVTNLINGKVYIGKTVKGLEYRKRQHVKTAFNRNSQFAIHRALRKYGIENFDWCIIDSSLTEEELSEKEKYWIKHYNSYGENGYNMTLGGDGVSGLIVSEETRKRISILVKNSGLSRGIARNVNDINVKLTEDDVLEIKKLIKEGISLTTICEKFNVSSVAIGLIKAGKNWGYIGEDLSQKKITNNGILTEKDVLEIKELIKSGLPHKEIAEKFNVTVRSIRNIIIGKTWSHIGEDLSHMKYRHKKLKKEQVIEIKFLLNEGKLTQTEIAKLYDTTVFVISKIKTGASWAQITI